ncbi:MAG TPA: hypothetical protein VFA23_17030 [Dongiaceae bacterium]|nr:hypothetical protein [Dongiaceae bacterium]
MAQFGYGFGGRLHLLRYLGWHRGLLDASLGEALRAKSIRWLDFGFSVDGDELDAAPTGLDFLPRQASARRSWRSIWPNDLHPVTWDGVGEVVNPRDTEWILVEAVSHLEELRSNCESKSWRDGLSLIADALARTQNALGVSLEADWLRGHYHYASRLAALTYLLSQGEKARLVTVCFCGDRGDLRRSCPQSRGEWEEALAARDRRLQLPARHRLSAHIQRLFLDVRPEATQAPYPARRARIEELLHEA